MLNMLVRQFVILCICAGSLADRQTDWKCVSWDDRIEHDVFQPLREKLREFSSEYKNFTGAFLGWHGWGVEWQGGTSGNYSEFRLDENNSKFCTSSGVRMLTATFTYEELKTRFEEVEFYTPFFELGDYEPTIIFKGVKVHASINSTTDATSKKCDAALEDFQLQGFDSLQMSMTGDVSSWIIRQIFNWIASPKIAAFLRSNDENDRITSMVKQFLAPAVRAQSEFFCKIMS